MTGMAFYVAYLLPILLIVTTNLVVMGFFIKSLQTSNQVSKDRRMTGLTIYIVYVHSRAKICIKCSIPE